MDSDRRAAVPVGREVYEQLRSAIAGSRRGQGYRLPSSRLLAWQLAVSRNTVSAAIEQLAAEGYLDIARGRRPSIAAGLARPFAGGVGGHASVAPLRLSLWARRIGQAGWPFSRQAPARPVVPRPAHAPALPHDVWGPCLRRAARTAPWRSG